MMRMTGALVAALLAGWSASALAEDGNLNLAPSGDWLIPLDDSEMYRRGGSLGGVAFRVIVKGSVDADGAGELTLSVNVNDGTAIPGTFTTADGTLVISTAVGGSGVGGISTIIQIPGSNVQVNSSVFVQIAIVNFLNASEIPDNLIDFVFGP